MDWSESYERTNQQDYIQKWREDFDRDLREQLGCCVSARRMLKADTRLSPEDIVFLWDMGIKAEEDIR
jgi:hypothetical protein